MRLKKGFTLIELLVVIAIIAILATIVIINVAGARTKAQDAKVMDDVATIAHAAEIAKVEMGLPDVLLGALAPNSTTYLPLDKTFAAADEVATLSYTQSLGLLLDSNSKQLIGSNPAHPISGQYYYFDSTPNYGGYFAISGRLSDDRSRVQIAGHSGVNVTGIPMELGEKGGGIDWCLEYIKNHPSGTRIDGSNNYVLGKDSRALAGTGPVPPPSAEVDCTKNSN